MGMTAIDTAMSHKTLSDHLGSFYKMTRSARLVVHVYNPSIPNAESGSTQVPGENRLHSKILSERGRLRDGWDIERDRDKQG